MTNVMEIYIYEVSMVIPTGAVRTLQTIIVVRENAQGILETHARAMSPHPCIYGRTLNREFQRGAGQAWNISNGRVDVGIVQLLPVENKPFQFPFGVENVVVF